MSTALQPPTNLRRRDFNNFPYLLVRHPENGGGYSQHHNLWTAKNRWRFGDVLYVWDEARWHIWTPAGIL